MELNPTILQNPMFPPQVEIRTTLTGSNADGTISQKNA